MQKDEMRFEIKYEDEFERPIDLNDIDFLKTYIKVYNKDGFAKKKEEYKCGEIIYIIYYLDVEDKVNDILAEHSNIASIEIRERQCIGDYTKIYHKEYSNGELLEDIAISVLDKSGREIYYSSDKEIRKFFYNSTGETLYEFWYYNKSPLSHMFSYNPLHREYINEFKQDFSLEEVKKLEGISWELMAYYHSAEPVIPNDGPSDGKIKAGIFNKVLNIGRKTTL